MSNLLHSRYVDGHEREDVVKDRERYCAEIKVYRQFMNEYGGDSLMDVVRGPKILLNDMRIVLVSHDESVLHQNDGTRWSYREKGHENMPLQQKAMGAGLHVSGFLSEDIGVIEISEDKWRRYLESLPSDEARQAAQPNEFHAALGSPLQANIKVLIGKAHATDFMPSGYWTGEHVLKQLEHAVTLFEATHPNCIGLFQFDNSTGHSKLAEDALLTSNLGLNPGGQVSRTRLLILFSASRPYFITCRFLLASAQRPLRPQEARGTIRTSSLKLAMSFFLTSAVTRTR